MIQTIHLKVMSSLLAIRATEDFVTIPANSVIATTDDLAKPGYRLVRYLGESLLVFMRDIQERTQRMAVASVV
jgi:hypothetical protein